MTNIGISQWIKAIYRYCLIPIRLNKASINKFSVVIGFSPWKTFISDWLPNCEIRRERYNLSKKEFWLVTAPLLLRHRSRAEVFVWGYKEPDFVRRFCERHKIPLNRVEDGFIRSVQLGATKVPPLSICIDRQALYYDPTSPSDLEEILNTFPFDANPEVVARGRAGIEALLASRLSKYNVGLGVDVDEIYGPKDRKRILVLGQVEGDMSILKGCNIPGITNNDLVWIARSENPKAQIIYKPHPEVLRGIRKDPPQSDSREVLGIAQVLFEDISLADALQTIDQVYTITSLSGFEALIRGIPVTCLGAPFYSGWGLTDDRQRVARRSRKLTIEQLFAGAYILYPRYFDPYRRRLIEFEEALSLLETMKKGASERERLHRASGKGGLQETAKPDKSNVSPAELQLETLRTIRKMLEALDPPKKAITAPKPPARPIRSKLRA
ncbi:capsular polysaccharide biosynthesis protein [Pseudaminobacter sp. 19-2017]|uniref:Capsular polysaccharide biosynthesis protein n=1 Tax=Pseudaminobacter soli (ex Zhang et al. 2022) TaxID=2831468 RepID=A0A942DZS2_9HYPH|nr:capsular polysaccharide biosynthesis protein [Pseudaminobacter soli]MBS3650428.1 capsular polysaccharide biosynthesis protein [Pseudaminobacter soli]